MWLQAANGAFLGTLSQTGLRPILALWAALSDEGAEALDSAGPKKRAILWNQRPSLLGHQLSVLPLPAEFGRIDTNIAHTSLLSPLPAAKTIQPTG